RGARVLGLDRHHPPHDQGSSHGETRITRQAIGEGMEYVPLALRAHQLWREIEAESGETLLRQVGALLISAPALGGVHHGKHDFLEQTLAAASAFAIPHEILTPAEVRARYPLLRLANHEVAYFEPGAGLVYPECCIAAELALARSHGAKVRLGEAALAIEPDGGGVRVVTDSASYEAARAVVCAGPWIGGLLGGPFEALQLHRQTQHWFEPDDPAAFAPDRFPVFIWMHGRGEGEWFYGFPRDPDRGGVKIAAEQFATITADPDSLDRLATKAEAQAVHARHVAGRIEGLPPAWLRSAACVYTTAPASRFIVGPDPARARVIAVSACSGHGFKHSPAIGEAVAAWALENERPAILAPFGPDNLYAG
ncbi:MAG TPA: N-methyl-L-tryptophan oxidase, partial [Caulobacteraceae bacterium]